MLTNFSGHVILNSTSRRSATKRKENTWLMYRS
nr:MAG TPA: hypothetical protein [Caudoviricetes sp.]DAW54537.1 MAG TPA: hypothetical protein [Caudoviricetes sp.]DAX69587.1 MAG TPA: hypothetical protein [Caudoviricetes sp.]